jgi:hypothetical protein
VITRFDHVVIGVRDLHMASDAFRRLGFDVRPGGNHTGLGTHNALIRFGLDYLELLAIHDAAEAARFEHGRAMAEFLHDRPAGLLGFALASSNVDEEAARGDVPALDYTVGGTVEMQRARPDGHVLSWRVLMPGEHTWQRPWPFLIEWQTPDTQRLAWDGIGRHANGVTAVAGLTVGARDLDAIGSVYQGQLGLLVEASEHVDGARHMRVQLPGGLTVDLMETEGEGLVEVQLRVSDLDTSRNWFDTHGIHTDERSAGEFGVASNDALGVRLVFVA